MANRHCIGDSTHKVARADSYNDLFCLILLIDIICVVVTIGVNGNGPSFAVGLLPIWALFAFE